MPLTLTFSPNWVELSLNSVRQARCACVFVCVHGVCVYSSACFLSNVVQLTWLCVFVFVICSRISSLSLPSARTTETHTQRTHTHSTAKWHRERFVLDSILWLQLALRGVYLDVASTCCTNININQLTISTSSEWRWPCTLFGLSPAALAATAAATRNRQFATAAADEIAHCLLLGAPHKCQAQLLAQCECELIKFECAQSKTNTQYRRVCVCHMCVSACACVWLCLLCDN